MAVRRSDRVWLCVSSSISIVGVFLLSGLLVTGCNRAELPVAPAPHSSASGTDPSKHDSVEISPVGGEMPVHDSGVEAAPDTGVVAPADNQPSEDQAGGLVVLGDNATPGDVEPKAATETAPQASVNAAPVTAAALPVEANVATLEERNQTIAADWPEPQAVLFVSGQQHGYIEPCGCTGLENQKGGLIRRDTLLKQLSERGWNLIPVDVGNQVRRTGRQPELKFQTTVDSFRMMGYRAVALGIDDLKLSSIELIQMAGSDGIHESSFLSANVTVIDESFFPSYRIVEAGGRKIGITAVLGSEHQDEINSGEIQFFDPVERLKPVMQSLEEEGCDFKVLLAHASLEDSAELARQVPGFDLVVTAGGFGEPTLTPEKIEGSLAQMVQVGTKGMYGGIVGIFDDPQHPIRYQKIAISSQFKDSERMLAEFAQYQQRLADAGFEGLGISPMPHPTGRTFVGSEACSDCHSTAFDIWQGTPHSHATTSIVEPDNERGGIARHHDPECISCHATGWNPQQYYPYESGYLSPETTPLMVGSGCENCHGPGSEHVAAELGEIDVTSERLKELQQQMVLPLDQARNTCLECHDLDNSPDFDFDSYWEQVKHYGKD